MEMNGLFTILMSFLIHAYFCQALPLEPTIPLVERLGFPPNAKLLIIHADDAGVAHSINQATIEVMEKGFVSSASIMVPCPWFPEIADYARSHNDTRDFGIHLTLTGEWDFLRWRGVLSEDRVGSLLDNEKYMYPSVQEVVDFGKIDQIEFELNAQISRAFEFGVSPTHFDPHMGTMRATLELFDLYLRLGRQYRTPVRIARHQVTPEMLDLMTSEDVLIDFTFDIQPDVTPENWSEWYFGSFRNLPEGTVSVVNIHAGYDNKELRGVTVNYPNWGSAWRQRDLETFMDPALEQVLSASNVTVITWGLIQERIYS